MGRDTLIERDADTGAFFLRVGGEASAGVVAPAATSKIQVRQAYDNLGNLVRLADPKGLIETRRYDERNRLVWTVYPDDLRHSLGYDLGSRAILDSLQMVTHPESLTVRTSTYDAQDRPLTENFGTNFSENVTYSWDAYASTTDPGRLLAVTRGTGVVASYVYDGIGRRVSRNVLLPSYYGATQSWAYDLAGSPTRSDLPGTAHLSTGYDLFHRLSSVAVVHGTDSIPALHDISYRPNDLLAGYGLGTRLTAKESYEAQRAVLTQSVITKPVTNDTLYLQRMSWDGAGNVAGMRRNLGDSLGFDVDHLYQLREVHYPDGQALTVGYDLNGNRTKLAHPMSKGMTDTFALNGNRVTGGSTARKGWTVYRHDSRGNLSLEASFAWVADTGNLALAWRVVESRFNKRNELVRVRVINRMPAADTTWLRFDYGEDGNRILSALGKGSDTSTWLVTHKWVYDGSVIAADSGSDHGWTWHAYNGLTRVAETTDSAGRTRVRYVLTDHQGTVQALLSDIGDVLGRWVWDPWGNIEESWTQRTTDLLYQGKPYETALGEWYFNARWYNPERGSFTGRDANQQYYTPYGYVGNGPFGGIDSDGRRTYFINGIHNPDPTNPPAYAGNFAAALQSRGVDDVRVFSAYNSESGLMGLLTGVSQVGKEMQSSADPYSDALVGRIVQDLKTSPLSEGDELNLIGYSGGGQLAANAAAKLSGIVGIDNLVLIGAPVFIGDPKNVGQVTSIKGGFDPLSSSWPGWNMVFGGWVGHTGYFAPNAINNTADLVAKEIQ